MNTSALIFMILAQVTITAIMLYFLIRAMRAKKRPEPDSYTDNDEQDW
ncbi:MAG: hypothetical protein PHD25_05940 [Bacteroidales bacterium]|nr:hypothetical protein [Bacteroidales bacterium]